MQMIGEKTLPLSRQVVWDALNDTEVLRICIPGCESITSVGDGKYEVAMQAAIGPIKARFKGFMQVGNVSAPQDYSLTFEGAGGAAGFARGDAHVRLDAIDADQTLLQYRSDATVGGKLAQVGSRLVDAAARMMADRFFGAFVKHLSDRAANDALPVEAADEVKNPEPAPGKRGIFARLKNAI